MYTNIKKATNISKNENIVLLGYKNSSWEGYGLTKVQLDFIKSEINKDKKLITINNYNYYILIQLFENKKEPFQTAESCRKIGEKLLTEINNYKLKSITVIDKSKQTTFLFAFVEGIALGNYQFLKYYKNKKEINSLETIKVLDSKINLEELQIIVDATCKARDLVNEPVSFLTAVQLSDEFKLLAKQANFKVQVLNKAKIKSLKMGGLLAVNAGSTNPPTFSVMEWKPAKAINKKPYILIGKGIVFDTGGLSLKPTYNSMDSMKSDMAGAATVACTLYAIAKTNLPLHVMALVPSTDNRPGGDAYAPGDVIKMHNGLTVEVLNTDAEGRMILADALSYAQKYKPELVIDLATLTGSANAAIGSYGIVCMGNASEEIKASLKQSGNETYERLVEFPFWEEYEDLIKSDIADIKNIGGPTAGAITAGKFLEKFTNYPWIHFDIAGPAFVKTSDSYRGKNATGVGVRLLFNYFKRISKQ